MGYGYGGNTDGGGCIPPVSPGYGFADPAFILFLILILLFFGIGYGGGGYCSQ